MGCLLEFLMLPTKYYYFVRNGHTKKTKKNVPVSEIQKLATQSARRPLTEATQSTGKIHPKVSF